MDFKDVTLTEVKRYLELTGRHGAQVLSLLGRVTPNIHAVLETEVGQEILKEDVKRIEELMALMYEEKHTDDDRAELRYLRRRVTRISEKLRIYLEKTEEIKKVTTE